MDGLMDRSMIWWMDDGWMNGQMDGWINGWIIDLVGGWMDGCVGDMRNQCFHKSSLPREEPILRQGPEYLKPGP